MMVKSDCKQTMSSATAISRWTRSLVAGAVVTLALPLATTVLEPVLGPGLTGSVQAQETRRAQAIRSQVFEKLEKAQEAAEAEDYRGAIRALDEVRDGRMELNSFERANLFNLYAFVYFSQDRYEDALEAYRTVVRQEDIPEALERNTRYTIAQLLFVMDRWQEGIDELRRWFAIHERAGEDPGANAYALLAQAYYQLDDMDRALENIEIAINNFKERGRVPREQWWALQRFLYFEKDNYPKVVEILEEILRHYPKKEYWTQLAAMYFELNREMKALAAMEVSYVQGMLTNSRELTNLASMMLSQEVPYKAAKVLDQGMNQNRVDEDARNLELLGNAWRQARENARSIPVLERAAEKADTGDIWARLANVYLDNEDFDKAARAARNAIRQGDLRRPDQIHVVLGMAEFHRKNYDNAREAFANAMEHEGTEQHARQWLEHMENEIAREEALREDRI